MGTESGHRHAGAPIGSCDGLLRCCQHVIRIGKADGEATRRQRRSGGKRVGDTIRPDQRQTVLAGDKPVGTMGSTAGHNGLALIRTDRAADALAAGTPLTAGGLAIRLADPNDVPTAPKQTVA